MMTTNILVAVSLRPFSVRENISTNYWIVAEAEPGAWLRLSKLTARAVVVVVWWPCSQGGQTHNERARPVISAQPNSLCSAFQLWRSEKLPDLRALSLTHTLKVRCELFGKYHSQIGAPSLARAPALRPRSSMSGGVYQNIRSPTIMTLLELEPPR